MTKEAIRKIYKEKRAALSYGQREKMQDLLMIQFQKLPLDIPATIMSYQPFKNEFDPAYVIDFCRFKHPPLIEVMPLMLEENNQLQPIEVTEHTQYSLNKYGIAEPMDGTPIPIDSIDMVIVPLLAFDTSGHRVGYGKGYYDRFLALCKPDCIRLGFSFFDPIPSIEDVHALDVTLHMGITPEKSYIFTP